jgi:hypothetical protein
MVTMMAKAEGTVRKRKCGMCCFGYSYSVRSKKEYEKNMLFAMIDHNNKYN